MARFSSPKQVTTNPGGEALRQAREHLGLKLSYVSQTLHLSTKYLEALEAGNWLDLPSQSYARYFLRAYAGFLGLPTEPLLQQYAAVALPVSNIAAVPTARRTHRTLNQPHTHPLRRWLVGVVVVGVVVYLGVVAWRTFLPTRLTLLSPAADLTTSEPTVTVSGLTQTGAQIFINSQPVAVTDKGAFNQTLALTPGLNAITIEAKKTYGPAVTVERRVLYTPLAQPMSSTGSGAVNSTP